MKKRLIQIIITIIYLLVLSCCTTNTKEVRLKINANSNSEIDQLVKLEVKVYLEEYLKNNAYNDLEKLEEVLNKKFRKETIKVEKKKVSYEAKSYQNKIIPSGKYDTILITIGKGEGKNFWTLLYPEFFNISFEEDHEIEYRSYFLDLLNKK